MSLTFLLFQQTSTFSNNNSIDNAVINLRSLSVVARGLAAGDETGYIRIRRAHTIYPHTLYISYQPGLGPGGYGARWDQTNLVLFRALAHRRDLHAEQAFATTLENICVNN